MTRTLTITGAHGAQQAAVAAASLSAGHVTRGTVRTLPSPEAPSPIVWHVADLDDPAELAAAFEGSDAVVFTPPQDHRDGATLAMLRSVTSAAARAGTPRLVVNLAGGIDEASDAVLFRTQRELRDAALTAPLDVVVLEPTVYLDNLLAPWALPGILDGGTLAYPAPAHAPISWLSHASLGAHAVAACDPAVHAGRSYRIGGPRAVTGTELAALIGARLGADVAYVRVPADAFAAGLNAAMGAPAGDRVAELYRSLDERPDAHALARPDPFGTSPESVEAFVERAFPRR